MGWAKYMEDDMDIMQERNPEWNNGYFSYPRIRVNNYRPLGKGKNNSDYIADLLANVLDYAVSKETSYKDKQLVCKCCGRSFLFTASSQERFAKKGWHSPKRCKSCRSAREAAFCMRPSF